MKKLIFCLVFLFTFSIMMGPAMADRVNGNFLRGFYQADGRDENEVPDDFIHTQLNWEANEVFLPYLACGINVGFGDEDAKFVEPFGYIKLFNGLLQPGVKYLKNNAIEDAEWTAPSIRTVKKWTSDNEAHVFFVNLEYSYYVHKKEKNLDFNRIFGDCFYLYNDMFYIGAEYRNEFDNDISTNYGGGKVGFNIDRYNVMPFVTVGTVKTTDIDQYTTVMFGLEFRGFFDEDVKKPSVKKAVTKPEIKKPVKKEKKTSNSKKRPTPRPQPKTTKGTSGVTTAD